MDDIFMACFVIILSLLAEFTSGGSNAEAQLYDNLFEDYSSNARPVDNYFSTVPIDIALHLISLHSVNDKNQKISTTVWIDLLWKDDHLQWDPKDYEGVDSILIPQNKIWIPDFCVANEITSKKCIDRNDDAQLLLHHTGSVTWWLNKELTTKCEIDISKYPFDTQECPISLGLWYSPDEKVRLTANSASVGMDNFNKNEEWEVIGSRVSERRVVEVNNFTETDFHIQLKRRSLFYIFQIILPVLMLSILNMLCFVLPIETGEKVGMTMSIFLTFAVFMMLISESVPKSSEHIFLFGILMTIQMFISGLSIAMEVFVCYVYHWSDSDKAPILLNFLSEFTKKMSTSDVKERFYNTNSVCQNPETNNLAETHISQGESKSNKWEKLAVQLDSYFGRIVVIINIINYTTFFIVVFGS